jgi:hypothetical protein
VPGHDVFIAEWDDELPGLVDVPQRHGEWFMNPEERRDGDFVARYFFELPPIPAAAEAECDRLWREYFYRARPDLRP